MKEDKLLQHDPLSDADLILRDDFYGRAAPEKKGEAPARPTHYKVICISMYTKDIEELDAKVHELKRRGWTKANKSHLIRLALAQLDLGKLPTPRQ